MKLDLSSLFCNFADMLSNEENAKFCDNDKSQMVANVFYAGCLKKCYTYPIRICVSFCRLIILLFSTFQTVKAMSIAACQRSCNRASQCNAINYKKSKNRCQLMNKFIKTKDCHLLTGQRARGWAYRFKECAQSKSCEYFGPMLPKGRLTMGLICDKI